MGKLLLLSASSARLELLLSYQTLTNRHTLFSPDVDINAIRYGLSGISKIGEDIIQNTLANRPYTSVEDFTSKVKVNKPQVINLIKSGAFDAFGSRYNVMKEYIDSISGKKKRVNLQKYENAYRL